MRGDIVKRLRLDGFTGCDCLQCLAADEIERLRAERDTERAEIERLRAAGDALAEALAWWGKGNDAGDAACEAWQEARRER